MLVKKGFGTQISLTRFHSPFKQMNNLNKICLFKIVFHSVFHSKDTIITVIIITSVLLQLVFLLFDTSQQLQKGQCV